MPLAARAAIDFDFGLTGGGTAGERIETNGAADEDNLVDIGIRIAEDDSIDRDCVRLGRILLRLDLGARRQLVSDQSSEVDV